MLSVGIAVAKHKHDLAVVDPEGSIFGPPPSNRK